MSLNPYQVLGVDKTASADAIRSAYRALAKALHPDLHPGDSAKAEEFKRVSAAWDILGDAERRAKFDRGEIDGDGNERAPFGGGFGGFQGGSRSSRPAGSGNDAFEEILSGMFGGGRSRRGPGPKRGRDMRYQVEVDFMDAIRGARRRMTMADGRALDVSIPAGVETGQTLRLKSQGMASTSGGPPGDALLELVIRDDPNWTRTGLDLRVATPVSLETAVLGGSVEVDTPSGPVTLKVPEGSNTGRVLRLKGKGVQKAGAPGDLFVRLEIKLDDPNDNALKSFLKASKY